VAADATPIACSEACTKLTRAAQLPHRHRRTRPVTEHARGGGRLPFRQPTQIERRVNRFFRRQRLGRADDALCRRVVAGAIDRFDHREFAIAEAKRRERSRRRIAAHDPLVDPMREAGDHQLQVALIAPEPGQFIVGLRLADEGGPKTRR
jgi:hypothetical protein